MSVHDLGTMEKSWRLFKNRHCKTCDELLVDGECPLGHSQQNSNTTTNDVGKIKNP